MFPFLYILAGVALAPDALRYKSWLIGVLSVCLVIEPAAIYQNHLAFFNGLAGGPGRGPQFLLRSVILRDLVRSSAALAGCPPPS